MSKDAHNMLPACGCELPLELHQARVCKGMTIFDNTTESAIIQYDMISRLQIICDQLYSEFEGSLTVLR